MIILSFINLKKVYIFQIDIDEELRSFLLLKISISKSNVKTKLIYVSYQDNAKNKQKRQPILRKLVQISMALTRRARLLVVTESNNF